jgi:hypothetical protein
LDHWVLILCFISRNLSAPIPLTSIEEYFNGKLKQIFKAFLFSSLCIIAQTKSPEVEPEDKAKEEERTKIIIPLKNIKLDSAGSSPIKLNIAKRAPRGYSLSANKGNIVPRNSSITNSYKKSLQNKMVPPSPVIIQY